VNYAKGQDIPNFVIATPGVGGKVCVFSSASADVIVDVSGYFNAGPGFTATAAPVRFLDSRETTRIAAGTSKELTVAGDKGIPADVRGVALNVTAVGASADGFMTVYPCGEPVPVASNLNYTKGRDVANFVLAKPGVGGKVCFYSDKTVDIVVDVAGYFGPSSTFTPIPNPTRILDTRTSDQMSLVDNVYLQPVVSPNGRFIAYVRPETFGATKDIVLTTSQHLYDTETGQILALTVPAGAGEFPYAVSDDGRFLVYGASSVFGYIRVDRLTGATVSYPVGAQIVPYGKFWGLTGGGRYAIFTSDVVQSGQLERLDLADGTRTIFNPPLDMHSGLVEVVGQSLDGAKVVVSNIWHDSSFKQYIDWYVWDPAQSRMDRICPLAEKVLASGDLRWIACRTTADPSFLDIYHDGVAVETASGTPTGTSVMNDGRLVDNARVNDRTIPRVRPSLGQWRQLTPPGAPRTAPSGYGGAQAVGKLLLFTEMDELKLVDGTHTDWSTARLYIAR
jgi:hypothetical protein